MDYDQEFIKRMAQDVAARHKIPETTVQHPRGVIVPGNPIMTLKLRNPSYTPYCGPCVPVRRMRKVDDGFRCAGCAGHWNFDLTTFNGNANVQYESTL
jgi:hypothetical protein